MLGMAVSRRAGIRLTTAAATITVMIDGHVGKIKPASIVAGHGAEVSDAKH
jgi:hypothetical protein